VYDFCGIAVSEHWLLRETRLSSTLSMKAENSILEKIFPLATEVVNVSSIEIAVT
jgi:hypothetical protein